MRARYATYGCRISRGGMTELWVTPNFLMSDAHWQVLKEFWGTLPGIP
jgi:hypothetical protein